MMMMIMMMTNWEGDCVNRTGKMIDLKSSYIIGRKTTWQSQPPALGAPLGEQRFVFWFF
jgi:hypothetical protein